MRTVVQSKLKQVLAELEKTDSGRSIIWAVSYKNDYSVWENLSALIFGVLGPEERTLEYYQLKNSHSRTLRRVMRNCGYNGQEVWQ